MINFTKQPGHRVLELGGGANRHPNSDVNVDVRQVDGVDFVVDFNKEEWPEIGSNEFDIVYACFVLEHISWRQTNSFLKQVLRVLKPGGSAIFVIPNTEAQMKHILNKPEFDGDEGSMIYGTLDYPENSHRAAFSPKSITKSLQDAGFGGVLITPFGQLQTDMIVEAKKHMSQDAPPPAPAQEAPPPAPELPPAPLPNKSPEEIYNRDYFERYQGGGFIWNYPTNESIARKVLAASPESVLEIGCARAYVLKRLQDAGIRVQGIDVSHHAWLTRACDPILRHDLLQAPWPIGNHEFDLCFSQNVLEHIPEQHMTTVMRELSRVSKRGLHAVYFVDGEPNTDRTRCCMKSKEWWERVLPTGHVIVDARELPQGSLPDDYVRGDGRIKLNVGCAWTMAHYGWANLDVVDAGNFASAYGYNFLRHDVRNGLPYATGVVDLIFHTHFLEHLTYEEGLRFLRECRRVIRPDGYMRIVVPDASYLNRCYAQAMGITQPDSGKYLPITDFDHVNEGCAKALTAAGKLWSLLGEGHKAFYDLDTLSAMLEQAGWNALPASFRGATQHHGNRQILRECVECSYGFSAFCDATPALG